MKIEAESDSWRDNNILWTCKKNQNLKWTKFSNSKIVLNYWTIEKFPKIYKIEIRDDGQVEKLKRISSVKIVLNIPAL